MIDAEAARVEVGVGKVEAVSVLRAVVVGTGAVDEPAEVN